MSKTAPIFRLALSIQDERDQLKIQRDALLAAAKKIWNLIETGQLVRDTSKDHETGWAIKQIPLVQALREFDSAIAACEKS